MYWINELPSEIVEHLTKFLEYKDAEALSKTSDGFKELLNTIIAKKGEEAAGFSADDIAAEGCLYFEKKREV